MNNYLLPFTRQFLCNLFRGCLSAGDISPPRGVKAAMEMQAEAERKKRAQILESEGNQFDIPTLQMSKDDITLLSILKFVLIPMSFKSVVFVYGFDDL